LCSADQQGSDDRNCRRSLTSEELSVPDFTSNGEWISDDVNKELRRQWWWNKRLVR